MKTINNISIHQAIQERHSVRKYLSKPLSTEQIHYLEEKINQINQDNNLHFQLVVNEKLAYQGIHSYGAFKGVENYIVLAGNKNLPLEEKVGYYGEQLVLLAQQLGLNSCWTALTYKKINGAFTLLPQEKVYITIALGYGENQGQKHKSKKPTDVSNLSNHSPEWFRKGVEYALLAPTAVNQQKFYLKLDTSAPTPTIQASEQFSFWGYSRIDLGIVKLHFEIGSGTENFIWK